MKKAQNSPSLEVLKDVHENGQFADGLMSLLRPIVTELDTRVRATRASQIQLRQQIDSLSEVLQQISDNHHAPYDLEMYVNKLQDSRKRVAIVQSILMNAQERLQKLHQSVEKENQRRKSAINNVSIPDPPQNS